MEIEICQEPEPEPGNIDIIQRNTTWMTEAVHKALMWACSMSPDHVQDVAATLEHSGRCYCSCCLTTSLCVCVVCFCVCLYISWRGHKYYLPCVFPRKWFISATSYPGSLTHYRAAPSLVFLRFHHHYLLLLLFLLQALSKRTCSFLTPHHMVRYHLHWCVMAQACQAHPRTSSGHAACPWRSGTM